MNIQRLRNLTTGRLHTEIDYVYEDLGTLIGEEGLMTHMLPRVLEAVKPWLKDNIKDERFWDGKYDITHVGEYALPQPTKEDQATFFERFKDMPNPLASKTIIPIIV